MKAKRNNIIRIEWIDFEDGNYGHCLTVMPKHRMRKTSESVRIRTSVEGHLDSWIAVEIGLELFDDLPYLMGYAALIGRKAHESLTNIKNEKTI